MDKIYNRAIQFYVFFVILVIRLHKCGCVSEGEAHQKLSVGWSLPDTTARVGRLFQYHIPPDTFRGKVLSYQVYEQMKGILPDWLHYNESSTFFTGIPLAKDRGHYDIQVTASGLQDEKAIDIFTISVTDDMPHVSSRKPLKFMGKTSAKTVNCETAAPLTSVTIVVDSNLQSLYPEDRITLINNISRFFGIAPEMLRLNPVAGRPTFDSSALVAGPGNAKSLQNGGLFASWLVGCGFVENDHMSVLRNVEKYTADGSLSQAIRRPILSWHVSNTAEPLLRQRRAAPIQATPMLTVPPPTQVDTTIVMTATDTPLMIKPTIIQPTKLAKTESPKPSPKAVTTQHPKTLCSEDKDNPPFTYNKIPDVEVYQGQVTTISIPQDAFYSCRNEEITLKVHTETLDELPVWGHFDSQERVLTVVPIEADIEPRQKLVVLASNKRNQIARSDFILNIKRHSRNQPVEFQFTLDFVGKSFSVKHRLSLSRKLMRMVDDRTVVFTHLEMSEKVIVAFTTMKLHSNVCPTDDVKRFMKRFLMENSTLTPKAAKVLQPYYVSKVDVVPINTCKGVLFSKQKLDEDQNVWVTTVVPAVVIVLLLLIMLIIAFIFYRKRRQGKMSTQPNKNTFINKTTPSIFTSEISEKTASAHEPLISSDRERPPDPPKYELGTMTKSTAVDEAVEEFDNVNNSSLDDAALIKPPPPVTASHESKQPKHTVQPGYSPTAIGP